jgi:hypothetical protein
MQAFSPLYNNNVLSPSCASLPFALFIEPCSSAQVHVGVLHSGSAAIYSAVST